MPEVDPGFSVKKPVSVWNRPLKADGKGIFKSLGKAVLHGATAQWTSLGADAVEGLSAVGLSGEAAEERAWLLLRRALLVAMEELAEETRPPQEILQKAELAALSDRLDQVLGEAEVELDRSFFERPAALPFLADLQAPFAEWLQGIRLPAPAARSTALRLPSYFALALHTEWSRRSAEYEPIRAKIETPFTAAAERERAWALYAARLERQLDEPMFGEAFGLRQVYVPLRAFYFEEDREGAAGESLGGLDKQTRNPKGRNAKKVAVDLESAIDVWLLRGKREDSFRILSGGPGSGKSSFAKMYAAKAAREGRRVLFIPLHQFNVAGSLPAAVGEFVRGAEILPTNPLDPETAEDQLLILFDGLDELSQQGRLAAEVAREFVREVQKVTEIRNQQRRKLLVLITGREPVVQANSSEIRERSRILHALPYLIEKGETDAEWSSGVNLLKVDQRQEWWLRYAKATGKTYEGLPQELSREDLVEITAQPLLNYLVALSLARGRLDFSQAINLNDIYADLLAAVYSRTYDRPHLAIRGMQFSEFTRVLEEIALAAWHGNGRTTTVAEIEAHCKSAGLSGLLELFEEGAKGGVTRVLTAFYFRQFGQTPAGDRTFEFTHKSFREYLTALRVVRALRRIQEETERRKNNYDSGWEDRQALLHWAEICGPNPMDRELFLFVRREVHGAGVEIAASWQSLLCRLISGMLRNGLPMELLSPRPDYLIETRQARNSEEALLAALNACARVTGQVSTIGWPGKDGDEGFKVDRASAGAWISRLRGQRTGPDNVLALDCISFLDLSECHLYMIDLYGADLSSTRLQGSALSWAVLKDANLQRAYLEGAHLYEMDLREANLREANLERAGLQGAYLQRADLQGADLQEADLQGADLQRADLEGADLERANLERANLRGANLRGANLRGAIVQDANIEGVRLSSNALRYTRGTPIGHSGKRSSRRETPAETTFPSAS